MTCHHPLVNAIVSACAAFSTLVPCSAAVRQVVLSVHVATHSGAPLSEVPFEVTGKLEGGFEFSDAQGQAVFGVHADDGDEIIVAMRDGRYSNLSQENRTLSEEKARHFRKTYYFDRSTSVMVQPGINSYSVPITAFPAVEVSFAIDAGTGYMVPVSVGVLGGAWAETFSPPTPVVVRGVRKGAPAEILYQVLPSPQGHIIRLTATQTAGNLDLGTIQLNDTARTVPVDITINNVTDVYSPGGYSLFKSMTLISADGQIILSFRVDPNNHKVAEGVNPPLGLPNIPTGTFFISPGGFGGIVQRRLLECIRNGKLAELDTAGVPKIVTVAGQAPAPLVIDGLAARDAILSVAP